jgi:hypothetical protein
MVSASSDVDSTIKSVALYLPPDALNSSLNVKWQEDSYGAAAGAAIEKGIQTMSHGRPVSTLSGGSVSDKMIKLGESFASAAATGAITAAKETGLKLTADLLNAPQQILNAIQSAIGVGTAAEPSLNQDKIAGLAGYTTNPRTDIFFKNVDYREHKFNFTLIPRNRKEAESIDQILNIFQFYMLPSFGTDAQNNDLFIGYPYEFEISTFSEYNGSTHHITTFDRCVLNSVGITQSSNDRVSFVDDEGGNEYYPSSTTLSLSFQEVRLQGRDKQKVIWRGKGPNPKAKYGTTRPEDFSGKNDPNGGAAL